MAAISNFAISIGATALALQECDIPSLSAPRVIQSFRLAGLFVYFGAFDGHVFRTAIVSTQPGKQVALPVQEADRCCSAVFEFDDEQGPRKVLFVSCYSHASDKKLALRHTLEVLGAACHSGFQWLALGDVNLVQDEYPLAAELAIGSNFRALDDSFCRKGRLPATGPGGKRRLDYGFASLDLAPVALGHHLGLADHPYSVSYDFDSSVPRGPCAPARLFCV